MVYFTEKHMNGSRQANENKLLLRILIMFLLSFILINIGLEYASVLTTNIGFFVGVFGTFSSVKKWRRI